MIVRLPRILNIFQSTRVICYSRYSTETNINTIYAKHSSIQKPTRVKGWVKNLRKMKDIVFIDLSDGTYPRNLQLVIHKDLVPKNLSFGASIESTGNVTTNSNNQLEFICSSIEVVGSCSTEEGYPFAPRKSYSDDYLRQYLHLRCRTNRFSSLLRVRHNCWSAVHDFFLKQGYIHIETPILTSNDCEGAGEVFKVLPDNSELVSMKNTKDDSYFDTKTYLTVSGQLHLEVMARSLSNVYCFGPTFRAENSKSRLHLSEFYMVEAESTYINDTTELSNLVESLVKETFKRVSDNCIEDILSYNKFNKEQHCMSEKSINDIISNKFTVIPYNEAADILENNSTHLNTTFTRGMSLSKDHELFLVKHNNGVPVFIVDWPRDIKPFYVKNVKDSTDVVSAMDLLCPNVGEVCGGSIREDNYEYLRDKIDGLNMTEKFSWYLELRKFGNVTTGGFGLGFERLIQVLLGTTNIKDTIPFPRWPHNCLM